MGTRYVLVEIKSDTPLRWTIGVHAPNTPERASHATVRIAEVSELVHHDDDGTWLAAWGDWGECETFRPEWR